MVDITVEKFLQHCDSQSVPELRDGIITKIARFYDNVPQKEIYTVHGDEFILHQAMDGDFTLFSKYGIYPDLSKSKHFNIVDEDKDYIWFIDVNRGVEEQYIEFYNEYRKAPVSCVVKAEEVSPDVVASIREVCTKYGSQINIWNVIAAHDYKKELKRSSAFVYEDITDFITDSLPGTALIDSAMSGRVDLCNKILEMSAPNKVFYIRPTADAKVRKMFLIVATILTYRGVHFEMLGSDTHEYEVSVSKLLSRDYMFLDDYLNKLADPVDIAIKFNSINAYVCVRQGAAQPVKLHLFETELNLGNMTLRNKNVRNVLCDYSQLEVISLVDACGLDAPFDEAKANAAHLNDLVAEFEGLVDAEVHLRDVVVFNFTNLLVYKRDGRAYIAYVSTIDTSYVYVMKPLTAHYKVFVERLTVQDYDMLCDVDVFTDSDKILERMSSMAQLRKCHFDKPKYPMGMLLTTIPALRQEVTSESKLSFLDVGVWSMQTSQCRQGAQMTLLEVFKRSMLRERNFLTFWGGCHPAVLTELLADSTVWR